MWLGKSPKVYYRLLSLLKIHLISLSYFLRGILRTSKSTKGAFFWDYSGIGILGIDGIRVLLGAIPFSESTEYHSVHSASDSRINRMNGIRFTRNTQNKRSFGKFLAGNPTRPPVPVAWLPVGRRSSSQVTSAMSIPFS